MNDRSRRGLTLTEVIVVIAIALALFVLAVPAVNSLFMLDIRRSAKNLALTYQQLHDEAMLRNVTFRIAYHLTEDYYEVQATPARALIFDSYEAREEAEDEHKKKLQMMSLDGVEAKPPAFSAFNARYFKSKIQLPNRAVFGGVKTPQYEEMVTPELVKKKKEEMPKVVYSYIFANGFSEHTVVTIVNRNDDEDGFTIEVEPLSGNVQFYPELVDWEDTFDFVPEEGPRLTD
ncbi:MAG: type II secretion system protein [Proteobacteria bacterium]|nr:type II secretion system protein [Pseudomonadota bacterium]